MKLKGAQVKNYRSVKDSGWIEFDSGKTIFVGPNEAGKTAILRALQQINPPKGIPNLDPLRDYPRGDYNDITRGPVDPAKADVVIAQFILEDEDKQAIEEQFRKGTYQVRRRLDNSHAHSLEGVPDKPVYGSFKKDFQRLAAHVDSRKPDISPNATQRLEATTTGWTDNHYIQDRLAIDLKTWLENLLVHVDEDDKKEEERYDKLIKACGDAARLTAVLEADPE